jgi:hypothetical protein
MIIVWPLFSFSDGLTAPAACGFFAWQAQSANYKTVQLALMV